jgi:hypothetical protein
MVVAEDVFDATEGDERSQCSTAAKCPARIIDVSAGHTEMGISHSMVCSSIR